ncbi:hypothetical protein LTR95_000022 [Oleoguttula sp. CCFEE 5521]
MSWMDSWSRPSKSQPVPAPYYLTVGPSAKYCHTCGRIIGQRRQNTSKTTNSGPGVKFCSERCKRGKPSTAPGSLDVRVQEALGTLLMGREVRRPNVNANGTSETGEAGNADELTVKAKGKPKKGDPRIVVALSELEIAVFGDRRDPEKTYGRRKNRAFRGVREEGDDWKSVDMVDSPPARPSTNRPDEADATDGTASLTADSDSDSDSERETDQGQGGVPLAGTVIMENGVVIGHHIRPPQTTAAVNFSVGGERGWSEKIEETPEMLAKRREGQKLAEDKEFLKRAVRRAVVFGLEVDAEEEGRGTKGGKGKKRKGKGDEDGDEGAEGNGKVRRMCEALMAGAVVEPSFAKGDWSVRWRED